MSQILLVIVSMPCIGIVLQGKDFLVAVAFIKIWRLKLVSIDESKTTVSILSFIFSLLQ